MSETPDYHIVDKKRAYDGFLKIDVLQIERDRFEDGTSDTIWREVMDRGDAVGIIAYDPKQDRIMLGRELRAGVIHAGENPFTLALPAGGINADESARQATRREADEEMGLPINNLIIAHDRLYTSAGGTSERVTLVFGTVTAPKETAVLGSAEEHENIKRISLPALQFFKMAGVSQKLGEEVSRHQLDMMTTIGAYWLKRHRTAIRKQFG